MIIDTNIFLEVYSCHDITKAIKHNKEDALIRKTKAKESFMLFLYLNAIKQKCFLLEDEAIKLILQRVPPADIKYEQWFTTMFIYFIKDYLLQDVIFNKIDNPDKVSGTNADNLLLHYAASNNIAIATRDAKLLKKCSKQNVKAFIVADIVSKINCEELIFNFLKDFENKKSLYEQKYAKENNKDISNQLNVLLNDHYKILLS